MLGDMTDRQLYMFILIADLPVFVAIQEGKRLRNYWNIVKKELMNGLEINSECVIITFNHGFSVFNVGCSPRSILMPDANLYWCLKRPLSRFNGV